jgi:hypothetical protein
MGGVMHWEQQKQNDGVWQSYQLPVGKLVTARGQNLLSETTLYVLIWEAGMQEGSKNYF